MKILPLGIHVLLQPLEVETSIVMPENSKGQSERALVLGIGEGVESEALAAGQTVIYRKYSPEEFELDGKVVYLIEQQDLMGIIE